MKYKNIFIPVLAAAMLSGCANTDNTSNSDMSSDGDKLQVYTSFYAMYDFARMIGGDMAEIYNICPTGSEPHEFEPTAQDMAKLSDSDVFIYNGMDMEHWAESVVSTLGDGVKVVEASAEIPNITENGDPHVWLDPENAYAQMEAIAESFIEADPENSEYYEKNLSECLIKINELDEAYKTAASGFKSHDIITSHEAYFSLCNAYGLVQMAVNGVDNEGEPTPARMAEIEMHIETNNIKYIFAEPLSESKVLNTIAADTGCEILTLDPFEGNTENNDYFTVMYKNLESLKKALS